MSCASEKMRGQMREKFTGDSYKSPRPPQGMLPATPAFYARLFGGPLAALCRLAARGECDDTVWSNASLRVADILEDYCPFDIEGLDNLRGLSGPCVIIANHISTLETFILPGLVRPIRPVTFVVKKSLTTMPFFGAVMRSRDPVVVGRENPREDLQTVLAGGAARLERGISIIVFPQSTRSSRFDPAHFNTIGVKLARRANAPVVPLALQTDAWGQGKKLKDFGKITRGKKVRFKFAPPMRINGAGKDEHNEICEFIASTLAKWRKEDGEN